MGQRWKNRRKAVLPSLTSEGYRSPGGWPAAGALGGVSRLAVNKTRAGGGTCTPAHISRRQAPPLSGGMQLAMKIAKNPILAALISLTLGAAVCRPAAPASTPTPQPDPAVSTPAQTIAAAAPGEASPGLAASATNAEDSERIELGSSGTSAQREGLLPSGLGLAQYVLLAQAGQQISMTLTSDGVPLRLTITNPDGAQQSFETEQAEAGYRLTQPFQTEAAGEYRITLTKADHTPSTQYRLEVSAH